MGSDIRPKGYYRDQAAPAFEIDREVWEDVAANGIRRILRETDMTVDQLAQHMGLSVGAVKHRLYGHKIIGFAELIALCSTLNIDPMCIIDPARPMAPFPQVHFRRGRLGSSPAATPRARTSGTA